MYENEEGRQPGDPHPECIRCVTAMYRYYWTPRMEYRRRTGDLPENEDILNIVVTKYVYNGKHWNFDDTW